MLIVVSEKGKGGGGKKVQLPRGGELPCWRFARVALQAEAKLLSFLARGAAASTALFVL
jgi:hypothetical protein